MEWSDGFNLVYPELSQPGAWVTNFQKGTYVGPDGKTYRWSYSVKLTYTGSGSPVLEDRVRLRRRRSRSQGPLVSPGVGEMRVPEVGRCTPCFAHTADTLG